MTRSASFDRAYSLQHNDMAIDVASSREAEEIPLRQMAGLNVHDNYESTPPPSCYDPASEPLQSTNMSDDGSMSSSTTLCGEAEDVELADIEAGTVQDSYQSPAPPTYAEPASVPLQSTNSNVVIDQDYYMRLERESSCWSQCCGCLRECLREPFCILLFFAIGLLAFMVCVTIAAARHDRARAERVANAIETFKNNCVAHGDIVQAHMDNSGVKSFSCVHGGGNDTVKAESQLD